LILISKQVKTKLFRELDSCFTYIKFLSREESPGFTGSGCWITSSEGDLRESAAEIKPP